jgi:hypothetical protein
MRLRELDQENLALRNKLIVSNEDNFNLQASIMASEVESKYKAEQEVVHLKSQLGFKVEGDSDYLNEKTKLVLVFYRIEN